MTTKMQSGAKAAITPIPSFTPLRSSGLLQCKCACGGTPCVTGECEKCRKKRLQPKVAQPSTFNHEHSEVPPIVHEVLDSTGQPLDTATRAFMESRLGYDFSRVRVHGDAEAAESARAVSALAYTVGPHIVFDAGRYAPRTHAGSKLLAHELTHVIQQSGSVAFDLPITISDPADPSEQEAERTGDRVLSEAPLIVRQQAHCTNLQVARQEVKKLEHVTQNIAELASKAAYEAIFKILNGYPMTNMLEAMAEMDRQGTLDDLIAHSAAATEFNKPRLEVAMDAVKLRYRHLAATKKEMQALKERMQAMELPNDQQEVLLGFLGTTTAAATSAAATAVADAGVGSFKTKKYELSQAEVTVVKAEEAKGVKEIKEAPAYYANKILEKAGFKRPDDWFSNFTTTTFLGQSVGEIHTELAAHLMGVERKLVATHGGDQQDPAVAGKKLGLNEAIGGARHAPTGTAFSMHLFGLAIDVNYTSNPWVDANANKVFERAGLLVHGQKMQFKAGMSYADLSALDKTVETYFSYLDNTDALKTQLAASGQSQATFWTGKSAEDAQRQIQQDLDFCAAKWERTGAKDVIKKGGFLSLPEDLVKGMELDWGASYGDIMHFDMRNKGSGAKIQSAIQQYKTEKQAEAKKT